jgi:hypothetical protein
MTTKNLHTALNDGQVIVTFTKKDGTIRIMRCTTNVALAGHLFVAEPVKDHVVPAKPRLFRVVDLDADEFRSFNENQILSYVYLSAEGLITIDCSQETITTT